MTRDTCLLTTRVQRRASVRATVQSMPPLVGLPQVGLDAEQLLDVAGFIEPKLHPDTAKMIIMMSGSLEDNDSPYERLPALDAQLVPGLGFAQ